MFDLTTFFKNLCTKADFERIFWPKGKGQDLNDSCFPYTFSPSFMSPIHSWGNSSKNLNSILAQCAVQTCIDCIDLNQFLQTLCSAKIALCRLCVVPNLLCIDSVQICIALCRLCVDPKLLCVDSVYTFNTKYSIAKPIVGLKVMKLVLQNQLFVSLNQLSQSKN